MLPELAVDKNIENTNVVIKHFGAVTPLREVSFVYSRNYSKRSILNALSEVIKSAVPKKMLDKNRGEIVEWR
jgi:LysR family hydrogen peroxide-inducible transcriptional activator